MGTGSVGGAVVELGDAVALGLAVAGNGAVTCASACGILVAVAGASAVGANVGAEPPPVRGALHADKHSAALKRKIAAAHPRFLWPVR